ncbi:ATP-dependent DNA ligase [Bradyrhizobium sp. USDA 4354]
MEFPISTRCTPAKHEQEVQLYAFDILVMGGDDLRGLPLHLRKTNLERLLARRPDGITVAPFERGEIGPDLFRAACRMGLEGLVSKHRDRPYRGGRQKHWIKVKNRSHPATDGSYELRLTGIRQRTRALREWCVGRPRCIRKPAPGSSRSCGFENEAHEEATH